MFQVRSIKNDSPSRIDEVRLLEAHRLARLVFEPDVPENTSPEHRNMDLDLWRERLSSKHADILYIVRVDTEPDQQVPSATTTAPATSTANPTPILAISLNYPRTRDNLSSYHIFISAVHPSARGQGLFSILLDATKEHARSRGYEVLTVSTVPERFERMFEILTRKGSGWSVVKWEGGEGEEGRGERKVVMKMELEG